MELFRFLICIQFWNLIPIKFINFSSIAKHNITIVDFKESFFFVLHSIQVFLESNSNPQKCHNCNVIFTPKWLCHFWDEPDINIIQMISILSFFFDCPLLFKFIKMNFLAGRVCYLSFRHWKQNNQKKKKKAMDLSLCFRTNISRILTLPIFFPGVETKRIFCICSYWNINCVRYVSFPKKRFFF